MNSSNLIPIKLHIGITSLSRDEDLRTFFDSLANQNDKNFEVSICYQTSGTLPLDPRILGNLEAKTSVFYSPPIGASAGRNLLIAKSSPSNTHYFFPNDTSKLPPDFVNKIKSNCRNFDLIVCTYLDGENPRKVLKTDETELSPHNIWDFLEGATVFSRRVLVATGGFDAKLGTGSNGIFQSGEGTDLIYRSLPLNPRALWLPGLQITGVDQNHQLNFSRIIRKYFFYGAGYGRLIVLSRSSLVVKLRAILGPFLQSFRKHPPILAFIYAVSSSAGRLVGMCVTKVKTYSGEEEMFNPHWKASP